MTASNADKQVLGVLGKTEKQVLDALRDCYNKALTDIDDNIAKLMGRQDTENLQSIIRQQQYQQAMRQQLAAVLDTMNSQQFTLINDYLNDCYNKGYIGTMYSLQQQGIPITVPIVQDNAVRAVTLDSKLSKGLYDSLGEDVAQLKKSVAAELTRGVIQGDSYYDIANKIAKRMIGGDQDGGNLYRAQRIARTEGARVANAAAYDAQKAARSKGADVVKQWLAVLDKRTRDSHKHLDGEIVEGLEEPFSNGLLYPGDPDGIAEEVINCRCRLTQRAKWALDGDELQRQKDRAKYFDIDNEQRFETFEKQYLKTSENPATIELDYDVKSYFDQLKSKMNTASLDFGSGELERRACSDIVSVTETLVDKYPCVYWDEATGQYLELTADKIVLCNYDARYMFITQQRKLHELTEAPAAIVNAAQDGGAVISFNKNELNLSSNIFEALNKRKAFIADGYGINQVLGYSPEGIAIHEYGHLASFYFDKLIGASFEDASAKALWEEYSSWYYSLSKADIASGVSAYAKTNREEFAAECFAELVTGNPRPIAQKYGEFLTRVSGGKIRFD